MDKNTFPTIIMLTSIAIIINVPYNIFFMLGLMIFFADQWKSFFDSGFNFASDQSKTKNNKIEELETRIKTLEHIIDNNNIQEFKIRLKKIEKRVSSNNF